MPAYYLEVATVLLGLVLLMAEAFCGPTRRHFIAYGALGGLTLVFLLLFAVKPHADCDCTMWRFYTDDPLSLFYKGLSLICTALVIILSLEYRPTLVRFAARAGGGPAIGEFFCLPVFICAGMMWMASAVDLTTIFVSLELVTIAFYVMTGFMRRNIGSLEAGVKFLILGALSTGFLVYGFTWIYGVTGTTDLSKIATALASPTLPTAPAYFAFALVLVALCFKVAAVPFHIWVPDVYQGAPTPITAFLSVGSKASGFIVATRILEPFLASPLLGGRCTALVLAVAAATLLVGNFAAIPQSNFKRLLAYSSISHAGYLLLALGGRGLVGDLPATGVIALYLAGYLCMTLLAFAVLIVVNNATSRDDLAAFNGLYKRSPLLAFALVASMASMAGIPLTVGFQGKLQVFLSAASSQQWFALGIAILAAATGFYYYFKVIKNVFWFESETTDAIALSPLMRATIIGLTGSILFLGFNPSVIFRSLGY